MIPLKNTILKLMTQIPEGRICSYGDIAAYAGTTPRIVGFILNGFTTEDAENYPWQRVVNRDGFISSSKISDERGQIQQAILKKEGIEVENFQIINPKRYWYKFN